MSTSHPLDAIVIGAGPNGLAAAITLARAGRSVRVIEAAATVGGGTRTAELTLPGFRHDICSAVHPLALSSAFFRDLPLERYGLRWIHPPLPLAHPLDDGTAVALERSVEATAAGLGRDADAYRRLTPLTLPQAWSLREGQASLPQFFARPVLSRNPYAAPVEGIYLCSASTPPGGGVHGMCGYHAAQAVLRRKISPKQE